MDISKYVARLYERREEGIILRRVNTSNNDWQPNENDCHGNVTTWCQINPRYSSVRGWLYFDYLDKLPFVEFNAHSAVRTPKGEIVDITPSRASDDYPFIEAEESEQEYAEFIQGQGIIKLKYYK